MSRTLVVSSRTILASLINFAIAAMMGCGGNYSSGPSCNNPNGIGGFTVHISDVNPNGVIGPNAAGGKAYGNFASALSGTPLQGCVGSFGSSSDFLATPYQLQYGDAPANWEGSGGVGRQPPLVAQHWRPIGQRKLR
jgi:hypothetical protein